MAVLREIRRQVGKDFPVGIKLNSADFQRCGFTEEESIEAMQALAESGIELVEISGGTYEAPVMTGTNKIKDSTKKREAYFLEFAEKARLSIKVPLMVTGGFRSAEVMASAISSNAVDLVGLARAIAIEPDLPKKLLQGLPAAHQVKPLTTGFKLLDAIAFLEITWYTRQLDRMGRGHDPNPHEAPLWSFFANIIKSGWRGFRLKRQRA